jgi:chaperonin GroEL
VEDSIVVGSVLANKSQTFGFDAQTEQYVDMLSAGIVEPAKVVRVALQDAASIAGLMITTEAMVAEAPKDAPAMPGGAWGAAWAGWANDRLTTRRGEGGNAIFPMSHEDASA